MKLFLIFILLRLTISFVATALLSGKTREVVGAGATLAALLVDLCLLVWAAKLLYYLP